MTRRRIPGRRDKALPEPVTVPPCTSLEAMPTAFSPLVTQLLAVHAHVRQINRLAEQEVHRAEFRLVARAVVSELLQAWEQQTGGHGTIDDLLVDAGPARHMHEV